MILIVIVSFFIGIVLCKFLFNFISERKKDNIELASQPLEEKFKVIVRLLNETAFQGEGKIVDKVPKFFNLYQEGSNQLVTFLYGTGHLTLTWRYKYFQNEVVHKRQFNNVRNINISDQEKIANMMINDMTIVVEKHKINVSISLIQNNK